MAISETYTSSISFAVWLKILDRTDLRSIMQLKTANGVVKIYWPAGSEFSIGYTDVARNWRSIPVQSQIDDGNWHFIVVNFIMDGVRNTTRIQVYIDASVALDVEKIGVPVNDFTVFELFQNNNVGRVVYDEVRVKIDGVFTQDEIKLLYLAGRKKLSEPANFRQIFSPLIDLTRDRATFYAGLEVSTSNPSGYVPVPESAVNMSITSAPRLKSDYTNADFYYQGHYWYQAQKIQFNLPIQFETVREQGGFSKEILLDEDKKTFVYEKEFKVTNPTAARLNVIYSVDPTALGFSVLQFPQFELDGINMVSWQPQNSTSLYLIRTDTLEPGEISMHWIKSIWTISKEELEFPAKLEDFRNILDWQTAQKLAENAAKGKSDTYVRVIKIDSNADVSNVTVLVPLKDVEDESDVVEAVALTGSRETLQVEKLEDGKIVVKVPADAFVSGHAEIKVFYNKETSWWKSILDKIRSLMAKIKAMFFGGG
ncbi:LamG-like jellyroll fold domain-containing protein [Thermococcus thioreducens]|uniref:LamG-like jellyroll fold domain-containing protein n=1 Tax=Thermococcus thioreducens TaxID=277988 RepID=UPI00373FD465